MSVVRYELLMRIQNYTACWITLNKVIRETLPKGEFPDFDALGQAQESNGASNGMVDRSTN